MKKRKKVNVHEILCGAGMLIMICAASGVDVGGYANFVAIFVGLAMAAIGERGLNRD